MWQQVRGDLKLSSCMDALEVINAFKRQKYWSIEPLIQYIQNFVVSFSLIPGDLNAVAHNFVKLPFAFRWGLILLCFRLFVLVAFEAD